MRRTETLPRQGEARPRCSRSWRPGAATDPRPLSPPSRITVDNASIAGVDWLNDGKNLVIASDRGGIYGLSNAPHSQAARRSCWPATEVSTTSTAAPAD